MKELKNEIFKSSTSSIKDVTKSDLFKDTKSGLFNKNTTSSIKDIAKSGAKGAAMYGKFNSIITLIGSIFLYSVIIWLSFTYITNVDYIEIDGIVKTCECEDKPYTTTTKDKSGNESSTTNTSRTCTTTFDVIIPDSVKAQGLLVMKYINTNNINTNNSFRSLNNINANGSIPVFIENTSKYPIGKTVPLYFVYEKPLKTSTACLSYIPKSAGYVLISIMLISLLTHILWTYLVFTNDTVATVVGAVGIYDVLT